MRTKRFAVLAAAVANLALILACAGVSTTPTVSNVRMTTDDTGETPTSSYAPDQEFYVFADLEGLQVGQVVRARWYAVDAEGVEPNLELNASDYPYEAGVSYLYFQLGTPDGGDWPAGSYRVELYLEDSKVGEQGFSVR
jgi:hypothetical protein